MALKKPGEQNIQEFKIPLSLVGRPQINRALQELDRLDDFLLAASAHKKTKAGESFEVTPLLDELARDNGYQMTKSEDCQVLKKRLKNLLATSPQVHVSFAVEPSLKDLEPIVIWFRTHIHPTLLLQIGLQPNIVAGCVVRTPNKVFDLSLRTHMRDQQTHLMELIKRTADAERV